MSPAISIGQRYFSSPNLIPIEINYQMVLKQYADPISEMIGNQKYILYHGDTRILPEILSPFSVLSFLTTTVTTSTTPGYIWSFISLC